MFIILSINQGYILADDFIPDKLDALLDATNYAIELANITSLKSNNYLKIKSVAGLSGIKNMTTSFYDIVEVIIMQKITHDLFISDPYNIHKWQTDISSIIKIYLCVSNMLFALSDKKIFVNSKKIAELNSSEETRISYSKKQQLAWLTINSFFPYAALIIKRLYWDKSSLTNVLHYADKNDSNLNKSNIGLVYIFRLMSNCSEYLRRSLFYKQINLEKTNEKNIAA